MKNNLLKSAVLVSTLVALGLVSTSTSAQALVLTRTLLGDPRPENPDNLIVDVTIQTGSDAGVGYGDHEALWTIDLNSPAHPSIKLDAFYFNLADTIKNNVSFSVLNPSGWTVGGLGSGNNAAGSGSANFQFEVAKSPGNHPDVTNAVNLLFRMTSSAGSLTLNDFLNAPTSSGAGGVLVGQMGAHLQSLTAANGQSNSGFATTAVPTPALLPGLIAMGAGIWRKRQAEQAAEAEAEA